MGEALNGTIPEEEEEEVTGADKAGHQGLHFYVGPGRSAKLPPCLDLVQEHIDSLQVAFTDLRDHLRRAREDNHYLETELRRLRTSGRVGHAGGRSTAVVTLDSSDDDYASARSSGDREVAAKTVTIRSKATSDRSSAVRDSRLCQHLDTGPSEASSMAFGIESINEMYNSRHPEADLDVSGENRRVGHRSPAGVEQTYASMIDTEAKGVLWGSQAPKNNTLKEFSEQAAACFKKKRLNCTFAQTVVRSTAFDVAISFLILVNMGVTLVESDLALQGVWGYQDADTVDASRQILLWVDITFLCVFFLEAMLRIVALEGEFFYGKDAMWNLFDIAIVVGSAIEVSLHSLGVDPRLLRNIRILKLSRALRAVRLFKFFQELRILVDSITHIIKPLLWAAILLVILITIFSVLFSYAVIGLAEDGDGTPHFDESHQDSEVLNLYFKKYFSSMPRVCLGLFMSITGGESWTNVISPLIAIHAGYGFVFIAYIVFLQLGVLNVVTSIFVAAASTFTDMDTDMIALNEAEHRVQLRHRLEEFFSVYDEDGDGHLTLAEFDQLSQNEAVNAFFERVLEIQTWKVGRFFQLLDVNRDAKLSKQEFVVGCMQMTGRAKNMDLEALRHLCVMIRADVTKLKKEVRRMNAGGSDAEADKVTAVNTDTLGGGPEVFASATMRRRAQEVEELPEFRVGGPNQVAAIMDNL